MKFWSCQYELEKKLLLVYVSLCGSCCQCWICRIWTCFSVGFHYWSLVILQQCSVASSCFTNWTWPILKGFRHLFCVLGFVLVTFCTFFAVFERKIIGKKFWRYSDPIFIVFFPAFSLFPMWYSLHLRKIHFWFHPSLDGEWKCLKNSPVHSFIIKYLFPFLCSIAL